MIRLFCSNNNLALAVLLVYALLLRLPVLFLSPPEIQTLDEAFNQAPLSQWVLRWFVKDGFILPWIHYLLGTAIVYGQAVLLNTILFEHKVFRDATFLPSLLYVLLASCLPHFLYLSGPMIAASPLIWAYKVQFNSFKASKAYNQAFTTGWLCALAAMFYAPFLVFFLFAFLSWTSIRPFILREYAILLIGFLFPLYAIVSISYFRERLMEWASMQFGGFAQLPQWVGSFHWTQLLILLSLLLMTLLSLWSVQRLMFKSVIQIRIYLRLFIYTLPLAFIAIALAAAYEFTHFFILALPLAALFIEFLKGLKRPYIAELIHVILLLMVLGASLGPQFFGL